MKRKLLSLSLAVLTAVGLNAQVNLSEGSPAQNGATTQLRAPNGLNTHTRLRAHLIIPAAEVVGLVNGDNITSVGFTLLQGVTGTASGTIQFYLENTGDATNTKSANWATATGSMTSVYNGPMTLPETPGEATIDLPIPAATPFVYTGGGLYVAYDYTGTTFADGPCTFWSNNSLTAGTLMDESATATPPATLTQTSSWRPEIRLGLPALNPNANDLSASGVTVPLGSVNRSFSATTDAVGYFGNHSNTTLTNVTVSITTSGANASTTNATIPSIAPGAYATVNFTGIPITADGVSTYTATTATDDDVSNNTSPGVAQFVDCERESAAPFLANTSGLGYNAQTSGIFAIKLDVPTSPADVLIKKVMLTINADAASIGGQIKGVLLNTAGTIIDSSDLHTIVAADTISTNTLELEFLNGTVDYGGQTVYFGFRQGALQTGYFPLPTVGSPSFKYDTYFGFNANGGGIQEVVGFGDFLMDAGLSFGDVSITSNAFGGNICAGNTLTLTANPAGLDVYDFNVGGASVQANALNTYSYNPTSATTFFVEASLNGCTATSPSETVTPITQFNSSFNDDICDGDTYTFGTQTLTTSGAYTETFTSAGGCDSVVTLNLIVIDIDPAVTVSGATLTATYTGPGATYQWFDCDNANAPIAGANSQSFTPSAQTNGVVGNYGVTINQSACQDQSTCTTIDFTGLTESSDTRLSVFPSPALDILNVSSDLNDIRSYTVYDLEGRIVLRNTVVNGENLNQIDINNLSSGTYLLELISDDASARKMFVKQ